MNSRSSEEQPLQRAQVLRDRRTVERSATASRSRGRVLAGRIRSQRGERRRGGDVARQ